MKEPTPPMMRVRDWEQLYENNRSRDMKRTNWFPAPNDLSADSYVELVSHEDGAAHLGVWIALLMAASRATPRGFLVSGGGRPHTAESLARLTRLPETVIRTAIQRLLAIGLLEIRGEKPPKKSRLTPHPRAERPQDGATKPQEGAVEGKGTEHHHQEAKRKGTGTEPQGRERPHAASTTEHSGAPGSAATSSQKGDDVADDPEVRYASPDDELKAIYQTKTGERITIEVLDAIRVSLEMAGVSMQDFVLEVRKHAQNEWRNPPGFLRDLSRRFRAKTRAAGRPVTAAEAEERSYKCPTCFSTKRGEGAMLRDGKWEPCTCASAD
ncbi:MAG TPA: hypothetical protein VN841_19160 [Bryobacteraceae bacterium]|nr:hypothetical protein [Bryobacteraceae bacterium]